MMIAVVIFAPALFAQTPDGSGEIPHIAPDVKDIKIAFV